MAAERLRAFLAEGRWRQGLRLLLAVAVVAWALSGTYSVGSDEEGLVLRFGRLIRSDPAGLHYHLPVPIERAVVVRSRQVRSIPLSPSAQGQLLRLTGDENILNVKAIVQYSIKDPARYAFGIEDAEETLRDVLGSVLTELVATQTVDGMLTTSKTQVQLQARQQAQEVLDRYATGLNVLSVSLSESTPPDAVSEAFNDVASAREDADKYVHEAEAYANDELPGARGEAQQSLQEAEAALDTRILRARGDAARFALVEAQYRKAPTVTRHRLLMETMEQVLPKMKKFVATRGSATVIFEGLDY